MYLSDTALREVLRDGTLKVVPAPEDRQIQPSSIDLRLGPTILQYDRHEYRPLQIGGSNVLRDTRVLLPVDLRDEEDISEHYTRHLTEGFVLEPGGFALGATKEAVILDRTLCAHVDGRSTLGRLGLIIHATAGFCDPGFAGHVTLELHNVAPYSIILSEGIGIGQLLVSRVSGTVARPYGSPAVGSKYGGFQGGPVPPNLGRKL